MRHLLVVKHPEDWPSPEGDVELVSAEAYLTSPDFAELRGPTRVVNLCGSYQYQSIGYYVSLLATARGHKIIPSVSSTQDIKSRGYLRTVAEDLAPIAKKAFADYTEQRATVDAYFGRSLSGEDDRLRTSLFGLLQIPLMRAVFSRRDDAWFLQSVSPLSVGHLTHEVRVRILELAQSNFHQGTPRRRLKSYRYDLAILHNPDEVDAPSNQRALAKFRRAAEDLGIWTELIHKNDYRRLTEFDALFIRETTAVNHHTYRFARKGAAEGLVVIDDPESILRCTNKVYLAELLERHGIRHPKTQVLSKSGLARVRDKLQYPLILKRPDGAFSLGTVRVASTAEFDLAAKTLLEESELILAQEFLPTEYDWRIGVLDDKPLFACRYYMARNHWQIIKRDPNGRERLGDHETVPLEAAPPKVVETALRATKLIGSGLYGVDLKEVGGKPYVIEVNDNPNIDAGVEDELLGSALYETIMQTFLSRIQAKKKDPAP